MPAVSVIISTYNRVIFLQKAIKSVLKQKFKDFEIIIIDDASTDNVYDLIENKFKSEIDQGTIRYYRNEVNKERSYSRNRGMELASGEYLAFLDDDDQWLPKHLESLMFLYKNNPKLGIVFSNYTDINEDGSEQLMNTDIKLGQGLSYYRKLCMRRRLISGSIYMLKKEAFKKLGGFIAGLEPGEDREFLIRVAMNYDLGYSGIPTVRKATHEGSFTSKRTLAQHALIREKVWLAVEENSKRFSYPFDKETIYSWYLHLARNFLPDLEKSRIYLIKAIKINPLSLLRISTLRLLVKIMIGKKT